jgi:signal transduction histidine kinase
MVNDQVSGLLKSAWQLRESEQWDRMMALADEARELSEKSGFAQGIPRAIAIRAFVHYIHSDFASAVSECIEALRLSAGDPETESRARSVLALVHWTLGNYEEALRNSDKSIQLLDALDEQVSKAFAYAVKGGILLSLGQLDEALAWHERSIDSFNTVAEEVAGRARALSGLGLTYLAQKRYEDALPPLFEALELVRRANNRITMARTLNDLGEAFEALDNDSQALHYHTEALEIRQKEGYRQSETTSLLAIGRIYGRRGDHTRALELLSRGLQIAEDLRMRPRIAQCHHALASVYQQMGQLAPALQHFMEWEKIKSELAVDQAALRYKAIALESQLEAVQRHAELESLASLGGLVAAIAHEINSPLGAIQSSANVAMLAAEKLAAGPDAKAADALLSNARVISEATRRISSLVGRLKIFAGIDQSRYTRVDLVQSIDDTVALLKPEYEDRVIVTVEHERVPVIFGYATELHQLFLNLLRNAVQAIDGAGTLTIRVNADDTWIRVEFTDNGRGIPPDQLRTLFTPGFSSGSGRVRASLSLFTCMAIVKKHRGDIRVQSELGHGSTFAVLLPRSLEKAENDLESAA